MQEELMELTRKAILEKILENTKTITEHFFDDYTKYVQSFGCLTGLRVALNEINNIVEKLQEIEEKIDVT